MMGSAFEHWHAKVQEVVEEAMDAGCDLDNEQVDLAVTRLVRVEEMARLLREELSACAPR